MRVAAIKFINALPLTYGLDQNPEVQLLHDTPTACCRRLIQDEVDVALIPAFATQQYPELRAMKGLGIAAINKTESVYLFARKALDRIESVVTDPASLTSVNLLRIILKNKYGVTPHIEPNKNANIHDALRNHDAVLVIGDEAILTEKTDYDHYDLATEWYSLTRLPFVFALWASKRTLKDQEKQWLLNAYRQATENWEDIYRKSAQLLGARSDFVKRYYNENLHYQLARSDYEGLLKFLFLSAELNPVNQIRKDIWQ